MNRSLSKYLTLLIYPFLVMHDLLKGKVALITGGGSGIGQACAKAFAASGAKVVISDIEDARDGLEETLNLIKKADGEGSSVTADVSDPEGVKKMIRHVIDEFGSLDCAVNNAGITGEMVSTVEYELDEWNKVIATNLTGVWLCMKEEIKQMKQNGGSIVNLASILGHVGMAETPAYTAAKHGVVGLTQTAAWEYGEDNIRINAVCPGFIRTAMVEEAGLLDDDEEVKRLESLHALNRMGEAEEVAAAILWLSSDQASFVTGSSYFVDGGYTAQ